MNLACVKCTSVLDKSRIGLIEVDLCPSCGGLWLDHGEIERLGKVPQGAVNQLRQALTGGEMSGVSDTVNACPACPGKLVEVKLGKVMVDYCPQCKGMFLDRGELDAAMAAVKGATLEQVIQAAGSVVK